MNKFIAFLLEKKYIVISIFLVAMVFGIASYYYLPRQENPDITSPAALVTVVFPGASAQNVELLVTKKIEEQVAKIDGIEKIDSISNDNFSAVIVTINYSVNKEKQWNDLKKYIDDIKDDLPKGCYDPTVDTESMVETAGMLLSVSGEDFEYDQLENYSEILKSNLINIEGINKIELSGDIEKKVYVEIDAMKLNTYNISIEDIFNLFQAQNIEIPSGSIKTDLGKINVKVPGTFESLYDIENLIITVSDTGGILRLKDISNVYFAETENIKKIYANGKNAIVLAAYFKTNKNIVLIGDGINNAIEKTKLSIPDDVNINKITFQPDDVKFALNDFILNLFEGVLFVIIVVLFGMGIRNAIIVSISLPLSIFSTFIFMYVFKVELQQISIAGLIMAVGILVDNSIVVADAIQVKLNDGLSKNNASLQGVLESAIPVLTSTLTTIAAFATLFVLPGEAGEFVKSMPLVIIISITISYFVSILIVPIFASMTFKKNTKTENYNSKPKLFFLKLLNISMKHKKVSITSFFLLLLVSLLVALFVLPLEIFPYTDKNYIYIDVVNQNKNDIESTYKIVTDIENLLLDEPAIEDITTSVGGYMTKFYLTAPIGTDSEDFAQLVFKFDLDKDTDKNKQFGKNKEKFMMYVQDKINANILDATMSAKLLAITAPGPDIEIFVTGQNKDLLIENANIIKDQLLKIDGLYNVNTSITGNKQEYYVNINNDMATLMGLTKYDIQRQVNIALNGADATVYRKDGKEYDIFIKSNISNITELNNFKIKSSATNNKIMLKQTADITLTSSMPSITRYNRMPVTKVTAEVHSGYSTQLLQQIIEKSVETNVTEPEITIAYGGEKQTILKYLKGLGIAGLISLAVIFIILMIQFSSLVQPLIILMTVPLSVIGSIFGLWIFNQPFSFTAGLGLAALIGIVVNNAILLIEYINRARKIGLKIEEACKSSVQRRFRPIILTTVTTVIGLVPLALSRSSFFTPLAITLMSGLVVSTFFTLIVIPTLYSLMVKEVKIK